MAAGRRSRNRRLSHSARPYQSTAGPAWRIIKLDAKRNVALCSPEIEVPLAPCSASAMPKLPRAMAK
jgi:hypothetical protein